MLETHISWVILTGSYAYKIKKPVDFGFLDYSSLEKRKSFCELELQLNQTMASNIYLEVVAIRGDTAHPTFSGSGPIIEYALKMREFPQQNLFNQLLEDNKLTLSHIDQLAQILADFHAKTDHKSPDNLGTPEQVHELVIQNFEQMLPLVTTDAERNKLRELQAAAQQQWQHWYKVFEERKQHGAIRACHGDVHLGNIVLLDDKPVIFDCIEFNEALRWTDVMADVAFLLMDLHDHQQYQFANHLLNRYLEITGDYIGLAILPYYLAYRAMVRAKVNLFQLVHSTNVDATTQQTLTSAYQRFMQLAESYAKPQATFLLLTHGLSASGKSSIARAVVEKFGVIQIRSDVERKRLMGLPLDAKTHSAVNQNLYAKEINEKTYRRLAQLSELILQTGYPVIVDATFLLHSQREIFIKLTTQLGVPFVIMDLDIPADVIQQRLHKRTKHNMDVSEARLDVIKMQQETRDRLTEFETKFAINIKENILVEQWQQQLMIKLGL